MSTPTDTERVTGTSDSDLDRPARIRQALRELVAERGFHGASMQAIAKQAGVAAGTAYVHYESKDDVVIAAYLEAKATVSAIAVERVDPASPAGERFRHMWMNIHKFLVSKPAMAQFLLQVEASPYAATVHQAVEESVGSQPMTLLLADASEEIVNLPRIVMWDLGVGPAIRLVASGEQLSGEALDELADSCRRAIFRTPHH